MVQNDSVIREIEEKIISIKPKSYHINAYLFVLNALEILLIKNQKTTNTIKHVTGSQLSLAVRDCALSQFGPTAKLVLTNWGINKTDDIGEIVYSLIDIGLMGKNDNDKLEDFFNVYDFEEEFVKKYKYSLS